MTRYFTGAGDDGSTGLLGDGRVKKSDLRMEALGTLDELSAFVGFARSQCDSAVGDVLKGIQVSLYEMMAEVAATKDNQERYRKIGENSVAQVETLVNQYSADLSNLKSFILPGDTQLAASFSMARAVCRRAERRVVELLDEQVIDNRWISAYLNRLSSLFYVLEVRDASSGEGNLSTVHGSN